MPNNPGRIDGDYSIGEKEEVKYIDPGNFGAVRKQMPSKAKFYLVAAVILFTLLIYLLR